MSLQSLFPQDLVDHERIRAQFNSALNSMNHAVDGRAVPAWQQAHMEAQPQAAPAQPATYSAYAASGAAQMSGQYMAAAEDLTLRQLVESYAADNDIQLLPKAGQLEEGLQVCRWLCYLACSCKLCGLPKEWVYSCVKPLHESMWALMYCETYTVHSESPQHYFARVTCVRSTAAVLTGADDTVCTCRCMLLIKLASLWTT